eukprot:TRINITY_DN7676_c0_g1_i2.p1 TRINITY_DN7676_c0_g1~~TRINITY_DN7676_c0_g1_i2.p1  ORF type:complete len:127 (+),score=0.01 TRINITY_DN7676_c0_g1_i2:101-481(+)
MVYIRGGAVQEKKSIFRLSIFSEVFWGIINFFYLFFASLFMPNKTRKGASESDYRRRPGDDGAPPNRRIGGFRRNSESLCHASGGCKHSCTLHGCGICVSAFAKHASAYSCAICTTYGWRMRSLNA